MEAGSVQEAGLEKEAKGTTEIDQEAGPGTEVKGTIETGRVDHGVPPKEVVIEDEMYQEIGQEKEVDMTTYTVKAGRKVDHLKEGLGTEVGMMTEKTNIDRITDKKTVV